MDTKISKVKRVPTTVSDWKDLATEWRALGSFNELGSQEKLSSASGFEFKHFLGLRVIYEKRKNASSIPVNIAKQFPTSDGTGLESLRGWQPYLDEIGKFAKQKHKTDTVLSTCVPKGLDVLASVWHFQRHVLLGDSEAAEVSKVSEVSPISNRTRAKTEQRELYQTPTPAQRFKSTSVLDLVQNLSINVQEKLGGEATGNAMGQVDNIPDEGTVERLGSLPDEGLVIDLTEVRTVNGEPNDGFYTPARGPQGGLIKDEQTVSVFLLALLSAITATTVPFHTRWLAERNAMVFQKDVRYVGRTDGHLRNKKGESFGLIEVKPRKRAGDVKIRVQESAQMAAWVSRNSIPSHDPEIDCKMFLLSQDKDELYVTFPQFSESYSQGEKKAEDLILTDFLRMHEYGPFRLRSNNDVSRIANFLHGYTVGKSKLFGK